MEYVCTAKSSAEVHSWQTAFVVHFLGLILMDPGSIQVQDGDREQLLQLQNHFALDINPSF